MTEPRYRDILFEVGRGLHAWSLVEMELADLFHCIVGWTNANPHVLFNAVINFDTRVVLCDRAMKFAHFDPVEREIWDKLSARLTKFYKKRHELAHFTLGKTDKESVIYPFLTTANIGDENLSRLTAKQIRERISKFVELRDALNWFGELMPRTRMPQQRPFLQPLEEPPLVARLRELVTRSLEERKQQPPPEPE